MKMTKNHLVFKNVLLFANLGCDWPFLLGVFWRRLVLRSYFLRHSFLMSWFFPVVYAVC